MTLFPKGAMWGTAEFAEKAGYDTEPMVARAMVKEGLLFKATLIRTFFMVAVKQLNGRYRECASSKWMDRHRLRLRTLDTGSRLE